MSKSTVSFWLLEVIEGHFRNTGTIFVASISGCSIRIRDKAYIQFEKQVGKIEKFESFNLDNSKFKRTKLKGFELIKNNIEIGIFSVKPSMFTEILQLNKKNSNFHESYQFQTCLKLTNFTNYLFQLHVSRRYACSKNQFVATKISPWPLQA